METYQEQSAAAGLAGRPDVTAALTRGVVRVFVDLGLAPLTEFRLPTGRRADVAGLDETGRLVFAEIKSGRPDFQADAKWPEYLWFCDRFFFAVDPAFPREVLPAQEGLIVADGFGGAVVRAAPDRPLAPARRKAMTLRFARAAAGRLVGAAAV